MIRKHCKFRVSIAIVASLCVHPIALGQTFSFDDIEFWIGSGANRAAFVIDWVENSPEPLALAWGYRWDGESYGDDMLSAIVAADPRLFAKLGGTHANPNAVYGLGYDADGDGQFGTDDGAQFDAQGFAFSGPSDLAQATDPDDYYAEGWFTGFWHYGAASSNPYGSGIWIDASGGMATRTLIDDGWDSWTYSPTFNFASFAENPRAALPPFVAGDFDRNGFVDTADYLLWRGTFGSTSELAADGNENGIIDAADYVVWREHSTAASGPAARATVPEPSIAPHMAACLAILGSVRFPRFATADKRR